MQRLAVSAFALAVTMSSANALAVDFERRLLATPGKKVAAPLTLAAVLANPSVREEAPSVDIPDISFTNDSELLSPKEIGKLADVGKAIKSITSKRPGKCS